MSFLGPFAPRSRFPLSQTYYRCYYWFYTRVVLLFVSMLGIAMVVCI